MPVTVAVMVIVKEGVVAVPFMMTPVIVSIVVHLHNRRTCGDLVVGRDEGQTLRAAA